LFSDYLEKSQYLNCGDVIWLHHSEANGSLSAIRAGKGIHKYNFSSLNLETWLARENLEINIVS